MRVLLTEHGAWKDYTESDALVMVREAVERNKVVALPTDTVFGLAGSPWSERAVASIFDLKRRPRTVALPVIVHNAAQVLELFQLPHGSERRLFEFLAQRYWPGPLTIVVGSGEHALPDGVGNDRTLGVRAPFGTFLGSLLELGPLVCTSANPHGVPAGCTGPEVVELLTVATGRTLYDLHELGLEMILDGVVDHGESSTVVNITTRPLEILRHGPVSEEEIKAAVELAS